MIEEQDPHTCTQPSCRLAGRCQHTAGAVCTLLNLDLSKRQDDAVLDRITIPVPKPAGRLAPLAIVEDREECLDCGGSGYAAFDDEEHAQPCDTCGGDGRVQRLPC